MFQRDRKIQVHFYELIFSFQNSKFNIFEFIQYLLLVIFFRCKLSEIPVSRPINGQDACKPGKPAFLPVEKLKLHYVVHYMLRGTWSDVVPEEEDESRIEAYKCNLCQKRFKNSYEKKEFHD